MNRFERDTLEVLRARSNMLTSDVCEAIGNRRSHSMYWYFFGPTLRTTNHLLRRFARKGWVSEELDRWSITESGKSALEALSRSRLTLATS